MTKQYPEMNQISKVFIERQGYTGPRPDILALLPDAPKRVLDVGCGAGVLGLSIKEKWNDVRVVGLDNDSVLLSKAKKCVDQVYLVNLNDDDPLEILNSNEKFDVIIFADILEHLIEPKQLLESSKRFLSEGGCIITSLPNVRHYSTIFSLCFLGVWPQRDRGIHDRTHLCFFTQKNMIELFEDCGLRSVKEKRNVRLVESLPWTNIPGKAFDFWPFRGFLTFQYLYVLVTDGAPVFE